MDITEDKTQQKKLPFAQKIHILSLVGMGMVTIFLILSVLSFAVYDVNASLTSVFVFIFLYSIFFIGIMYYLYITKSIKVNIKPLSVDIQQRDRPLRELLSTIFNPTLTFQSVKETNWIEAVGFYTFISGLIIFLTIIETIGSKMWLNKTFLFYTALFIYFYIMCLCLLIIYVLILHIAVRILGSAKGISESIKVVAYAPILLLFIPNLPIRWGFLKVIVIGVRDLHELPNNQANSAVFISTLGFAVIFVILGVVWAFSQFDIYSYLPS